MTLLGSVFSYFRRVFNVDGVRVGASSSSDVGENVEESDVLGLTASWACVRLLSGTIASLPLAPYRDIGGGHKVPAMDHPLYRLLHRAPNAEQTVMDFWEGAIASLELKGNAVALKQRSVSGDVIGLAPMAWDFLSVSRETENGPLVYNYRGKKYAPDDVVHIRGFGGGPEGGISTIAAAVSTFAVSKATNRSAGKLFANGINPGSIISSDRDIPPEKMVEAEARLVEKYAGAMNAGRPLLLNKGLTWHAVSFNPSDAQMLESRKFNGEEQCRLFGVPPAMVGYGDKASNWGTGKEVDVLGFQKFALRPRLKRIETALEQQLLTPDDIARGISIEFNLEGLLRADTQARFQSYQTGLQNGIYTINEVRAKEGLPPVEGGSVPRMQMQNVPISPEAVDGEALIAGVGADVQATALNGAQVVALQQIVQSVADGLLPAESGIELLLTAFPSLNAEEARRIITPAAAFTPLPRAGQ